jgi:hypothetical protein
LKSAHQNDLKHKKHINLKQKKIKFFQKCFSNIASNENQKIYRASQLSWLANSPDEFICV